MNPFNHMLGIGYKNIQSKSWAQLRAESDGRTQLLAQNLASRNWGLGIDRCTLGMTTQFSYALLRSINAAINALLQKIGARTLMSVNHFATGAFTTLDQLSEMLVRAAGICIQAGEELKGILGSIMQFLGRTATSITQMTVATVRWAFNLMVQTLLGMAQKALQKVNIH